MIRFLCIVAYVGTVDTAALGGAAPEPNAPKAEIRTPKPPQTPRINGPSILGVRPGNPFLYRIPATGARPMEFSAGFLPAGLAVDAKTGRITGSLKEPGGHVVMLRAKNALGTNEKKFKIVVGETISLTPPRGWNSWNAYHGSVTGENVIHAARAMSSSGLIHHGWGTGRSVAWNCAAKTYVIQQPPGAFNWMIGCRGENVPTPRPFDSSPTLPLGVSDSPGTPVNPQSLYLAQLAERLGPQAVKNIGY